MHVITQRPLRESWARHPRAETPLKTWFRRAEKAGWESFADVRADYPSADRVGRFTVFDIGGNKYRLVVVVHFNRGKLFVRHVLTHAEYDEGKWKDE
jgi:mRNA interferase HigB